MDDAQQGSGTQYPARGTDLAAARQSLHTTLRAGLETVGPRTALEAKIVNYADDLVICCRGLAHEAKHAMQNLMEWPELTVNEAKTRVCYVPDESFNFLGYILGRCQSTQTGKSYIGTRPSQTRITRVCGAIP